MSTPLYQATLDALKEQNLDVQPLPNGTLQATSGRGPSKRTTPLDLSALERFVVDHPDAGHKRAAAGFAAGVAAVHDEPVRSKADQWGFVECAGRLSPSLQYQTFEHGHVAACGHRPWLLDFSDDLRVAYSIELDRGRRTLTRPQYEGWNVTEDRITAASRSLLFYKTAQDAMHGKFEPHPPSGGQFYSLADGYDAARALIIQDLDYQRARRGIIFAVPHQDILLLRNTTDDNQALAQFTQAVQEAFDASQYPLTTQLYTYDPQLRSHRPLNPQEPTP